MTKEEIRQKFLAEHPNHYSITKGFTSPYFPRGKRREAYERLKEFWKTRTEEQRRIGNEKWQELERQEELWIQRQLLNAKFQTDNGVLRKRG